MVPADRKVVVFELLDAVLRSWWTVVAGACIGIGVALLVLNHTPAVYEATTRLDAFAEMLPTDIIRPTVADDAEVRLKAVQKEVLQQEDLGTRVLARLEPDSGRDTEALAAEIRSNTRINFQTRTRFFDVSYRSSDRYEAAAMANVIAELFIEANARQRAEMSEVNTRTLEDLAASVYEDLQVQEQEIARYRAAHRFETSDQLPVNQQMLEQRREDLSSNREAQSAALERIQMIEAQRDEGGVYAQPSSAIDPTVTPQGEGEARMAELEAELDDLLLRYSESHPSVAAVRRQIDELKARMRDAPRSAGAETTRPDTETPALDVGALQWRLQLKAARRELEELKEQERSIQRQISQYENRIAAASHVDATVREKSRGVEALRQQYEKLQRDILAAKGAQQVEERSQGMRFKVVDTAAPPATPVYPNPPLVLGVGALAGLALFVGPSVFRRLLRPLVGSESGLQQLAPVPVLVSIPTIPSPARARSIRRRFFKNFGLSLASVAALAAVTALHYLELL